jgi:hypothetical protein
LKKQFLTAAFLASLCGAANAAEIGPYDCHHCELPWQMPQPGAKVELPVLSGPEAMMAIIKMKNSWLGPLRRDSLRDTVEEQQQTLEDLHIALTP